MSKLQPIMPEVLSVEDARAFIGIGRTKFYELVKAKEIVPRKLGKRTLVMRTDLVALLDRLPREAA